MTKSKVLVVARMGRRAIDYSIAFTTIALGIVGCASVTSPPASARTYKIAVIADVNGSYGSKSYSANVDSAMRTIASSNYQLVLSAGDMVAGQKNGLDYLGMWDAFHNHVTRPLDSVRLPLLPSPGNHDGAFGRDIERGHYKSTFSAFPITRFNNGRNQDEQVSFVPGILQNYPFNYAVTMGPAVIIGLDATAPGGLANGQMAWLQDVLTRTAHKPFKIVFGHMPLLPFTFQRAHEYLGAGNTQLGAELEQVLERHNVQLLVNGHHHAYYQGKRKGRTTFASVPLLGSGARVLLTADRKYNQVSKQGFLDIQFDDNGAFSVRARTANDGTEIPLSSLPEAISIPKKDSSECTRCANFPSFYFLDSAKRTIYNRL